MHSFKYDVLFGILSSEYRPADCTNRVLPFLSVKISIEVYDYSIPIDPLLLFQRISLNKKFQENIHEYLQFELSLYPLALFDFI